MGLNQLGVIPFKRAMRSWYNHKRAPLRGSIDAVNDGCRHAGGAHERI